MVKALLSPGCSLDYARPSWALRQSLYCTDEEDDKGLVSMNRMHPITLSFHDPETESAFVRHLLPRLRLQGRAAIVVGVIIYFLYGALDHLFVPPEQLGLVWAYACWH